MICSTLAVLVLIGFLWLLNLSYTPAIKGEEGGIALWEKVEIGGVGQWILIRRSGRDKPVLLFLHGGAGSPETGLLRRYNADLENHFTLVVWEQRGAGKSCTREAVQSEFSVDRFVKDTLELTAYLRKRFGQDKIYLVAHSWGTIPGMLALKVHPEYYAGYVGMGQFSNAPVGERLSYEYVLREAENQRNTKALDELKSIGVPDESGQYRGGIGSTTVQRKWLAAFGGFYRSETSLFPLFMKNIFVPEYSITDAFRFVRGMMLKKKNIMMENEVFHTNLSNQVRQVDVPVFFLLGRYDYNCPSILAEEYFNELLAPKKQLIWFENSAHSPCFEEPEKFNRFMASLPECIERSSFRE